VPSAILYVSVFKNSRIFGTTGYVEELRRLSGTKTTRDLLQFGNVLIGPIPTPSKNAKEATPQDDPRVSKQRLLRPTPQPRQYRATKAPARPAGNNTELWGKQPEWWAVKDSNFRPTD
jgi:hypothetical protein